MADNSRIRATLPTIQHILAGGAARLVIISHLGRPDGQPVSSMSLRPCAAELQKLLGRPVQFVADCVGDEVEAQLQEHQSSRSCPIFLLENLRFHVEEEGSVKRKDGSKVSASAEDIAQFRAALSSLGDVYVNDAFGAAHRAHSSITGISIEPRVAGLLVAEELRHLGRVLEDPNGIDLAILGGAKVADKIQLIKNLLPRVKTLAIGTAMCFTFLKALKGTALGKSLYDEAGAAIVPEIMEEAVRRQVKIILATDFVVASERSPEAAVIKRVSAEEGVPDDLIGMDIGEESEKAFVAAIRGARSILWNGPVGVFEMDPFSHGTRAIVHALGEAARNGATTIVGGGDSGAAVTRFLPAGTKLTHVSTGGGASLELLEGKTLPGIASLSPRAA